MAGLLLAIPDLLALDLPALVAAAGYPGTKVIPATNYLLSLLALKLTATRRVSHLEDLAASPGASLFAGLAALPKTTALTTYSYRLQHSKQAAFLTALDKATIAAGLATGDALNLDFHAVMHWGQDPALEKQYVPTRSQRTRSVLTFFAEGAQSHTLVYANADLFKATQNNEILTFADHWTNVTGRQPKLLIFDSKVTTQTTLGRLTDAGITFITLRARTSRLQNSRHGENIQLIGEGHGDSHSGRSTLHRCRSTTCRVSSRGLEASRGHRLRHLSSRRCSHVPAHVQHSRCAKTVARQQTWLAGSPPMSGVLDSPPHYTPYPRANGPR
jgi:hypothetical protein